MQRVIGPDPSRVPAALKRGPLPIWATFMSSITHEVYAETAWSAEAHRLPTVMHGFGSGKQAVRTHPRHTNSSLLLDETGATRQEGEQTAQPAVGCCTRNGLHGQ